jgi:hypothetical protein
MIIKVPRFGFQDPHEVPLVEWHLSMLREAFGIEWGPPGPGPCLGAADRGLGFTGSPALEPNTIRPTSWRTPY